ncbi:DegV family protein [Tepidibacter thalassicus]|uniref:EDD domain protein, DegV family n=1 Tax=Tepidibacter thalassicus DSM 15285 TaxID=1123350 RepID=A0A1M5RR05_9FIRM|nr:DegV family protein [Tepidibacter thalassicus]SHH28707.1 EDD domain protein, DegV family [Tepidibacter thalassicus DSM 15285]
MVKIVTDSVSDLPKEYIEKYNINVIPLKIIFGEEMYKDRVDITPEKVLERIEKNNEFPKTSQITPFEFVEVFDDLTKDGDEVLAILMSSKMSGTYNSALIAKNELSDRNIEVVDSKAITLGYGLIVIEAAKMAKEGKSLDEIKKRAEEMVDKMEYLMVVDSLEYAYKGGRISKTQYVLSNFLNIKPIVTLKDGEMVVKNKVRGRKKVLRWIIEYLESNNINLDDKVIGINHVNDIEYLEKLKSMLVEKFNPKEIVISDVGCTVAVYSGLSAIALYFERED